jgi:transposase
MKDTVVGVDLAKAVIQLAVSDEPGRVKGEHRLRRDQFLPFFAKLAGPVVVVMEACGTAHYWGRELGLRGYKVVLLPPDQVRPYVRRGKKTDRADAKGLLEAYRNKDIRPVPVKTPEQQMLGALHRLRSAWMADRTARLNTLRGLLRETGTFIPLGAEQVVPQVRALIGDPESRVPRPVREAFAEACDEIRELERRVADVERALQEQARSMAVIQHLLSVPGIGLITATALVAFVGDLRRFPSARHFASFLGLTPREHSSGLQRNLGRISKRGDVYLRMLLIHGARSVLLAARRTSTPDRLRSWALALQGRTNHNKAAVALANKLARIAWAVCTKSERFKSTPAPSPQQAAA